MKLSNKKIIKHRDGRFCIMVGETGLPLALHTCGDPSGGGLKQIKPCPRFRGQGFYISALTQASLQRSENKKPLAIAKGFICFVATNGQMSNLFIENLLEIQQLTHMFNSQTKLIV